MSNLCVSVILSTVHLACTKPSVGDCFVITNRRLGTGYRLLCFFREFTSCLVSTLSADFFQFQTNLAKYARLYLAIKVS